jgi:hypothetical protein
MLGPGIRWSVAKATFSFGIGISGETAPAGDLPATMAVPMTGRK